MQPNTQQTDSYRFTDHNGLSCTITPLRGTPYKDGYTALHQACCAPDAQFKAQAFRSAFHLPLTQVATFRTRERKWKDDGLCYGISLQASAYFALEKSCFGYSFEAIEQMAQNFVDPDPLLFNQLIDWEQAQRLQEHQYCSLSYFHLNKYNLWCSQVNTTCSFLQRLWPLGFLRIQAENFATTLLERLDTLPTHNTSMILNIVTSAFFKPKGHALTLLRHQRENYCLIDSNSGIYYFKDREEFNRFLSWYFPIKYPEHSNYQIETKRFALQNQAPGRVQRFHAHFSNMDCIVKSMVKITGIMALLWMFFSLLAVAFLETAFAFSLAINLCVILTCMFAVFGLGNIFAFGFEILRQHRAERYHVQGVPPAAAEIRRPTQAQEITAKAMDFIPRYTYQAPPNAVAHAKDDLDTLLKKHRAVLQ